MRSLPVEPDRAVRWTVSDAFIVLLGTQLLSIVWVVLVAGAVKGGTLPDPLPTWLLVVLNVGLWLGYGGGPVQVARTKGNGPGLDYGTSVALVDVPVGLVVGVLAQLVVLPVLYYPILRLVEGDPSRSARELIDAIDGPVDVVLFTFSVAIMAPLVEELFYRGLLLRSLERRFGPVIAVVGSSAVFALAHRELLPLLGLFAFGVISSLLVLRTGRLGPAWAMHAAFNLTTLVMLGIA